MFKWLIMGLMTLPVLGFANVNPEMFVGKWQCHIKSNEPLLEQTSQVQFLGDGTMREELRISYGQKSNYAYQIETATAQARWQVHDEVMYYQDYEIGRYVVRMPNADKHDVEQAHIAVQKSLPIIEAMMNNQVSQRQFDVTIVNKKTVMMNDIDQQQFITCHKKGLLNWRKS